MEWLSARRSFSFDVQSGLVGGVSYEAHGTPLTDETLADAVAADAVLFGAVGGPQWDSVAREARPEMGILRLRKEMDLYANLRPALVFDPLVEASTLKDEVVRGLDLMIVRELTGGIYFGEPRGVETLPDGTRRGFDTEVYSAPEIERVSRVAFELARRRDNRVHSVEKANVMESGKFWRDEVTALHAADYTDVALEHMYADNCAMQLVRRPKQFDVIVTSNLFGDLLSDCAAMLTGSLGMLPSASPRPVRRGRKPQGALRTRARVSARHRRPESGQSVGGASQLHDDAALFVRRGRRRRPHRGGRSGRAGGGLAHRRHHAGRDDGSFDRCHGRCRPRRARRARRLSTPKGVRTMGYRVAVAGATGNVGRQLLAVLAERNFPADEIIPLASRASAGKEVSFGDDITLRCTISPNSTSPASIWACSPPGSAVSKVHAPRAAAQGCVVIDNTSQFRMDEDVPLVVPEVNGETIAGYDARNIIANPNCSTIQMVMALKPLHDHARIKRIVVSTYQSTSGAGKQAMDELFDHTRAIYMNAREEPRAFAKTIAFNVVPQIGAFDTDGSTGEEAKMVRETQRILDPEILVSATCVRVPTFIGHAEAVNVEFHDPIDEEEARELLSAAPGVEVIDRPFDGGYATPVDCVGEDATFVSRIRRDPTVANGLCLWIVSDNLRKGAALNAVQIAEDLIANHLVPA
ncbi:Aspartate-semialdehyde dehydrogenase [Geodia barretti]|nr:Aspartate-semialdehyde dehydrogenase [Geodia barretti]